MNTIICPHCQQQTTVTAYYARIVGRKAPVIFTDDDWEIDHNKAEWAVPEIIRSKDDGGSSFICFKGSYFTCDKCTKEIDKDSLCELKVICRPDGLERKLGD